MELSEKLEFYKTVKDLQMKNPDNPVLNSVIKKMEKELRCGKCGKSPVVNGSMITIMGNETYICSECEVSKVGREAKCDRCGQIKVIAYQDEVFQTTECQTCLDRHIAYIQDCVKVYKRHEQRYGTL